MRSSPDEDFEVFYRASHADLVASLTVVLGDVHAAREAADEACARAFLHWDRLAVMASPRGWLYAVALNVARRQQRRASREQVLLRRTPRPTSVPAPAGEAWHLVKDLPERQRTCIVLRYIADLREDDIAEAMGIARSTVSSMLTAAHRRLATQLEPPDDEPERNRSHLGEPAGDGAAAVFPPLSRGGRHVRAR